MKEIIPAPKWLVDRMESIRKLSPPPLKEVENQWKASVDLRKKLDKKLI